MANLLSNKITLTKIVNGQNGAPGTPGAPGGNGYNQATIYLYARANSAPSKPSNSLTYTFSTGELNSTPTGWNTTIPTGDNPCWIMYATAISNTDTDTIASTDWKIQKLVENGADGEDGYNQATINLYQRASSAPSAPTSLTYTFSTGNINGTLGSWSRTVPTNNGQTCYITSATIISREDTGSLSFVEPTVLVEDGKDGKDAGQYQIHTNYQRLLKYYEFNNDIQSLYIDSPLTFMVYDLQEEEYKNLTGTNIKIEINGYSLSGYLLQDYFNTIIAPVENTTLKYSFKIFDLYTDLQDDEFKSKLKSTIDQDSFVQVLQNFFNNTGGDIRISIQSDQYNTEKFIELKNGLSNEMLDFSVNARNITAAVDSSALSFSANGLVIQNGGFQIVEVLPNKAPKILLSYDELGGLHIEGSGSFTGKIYADEGNFKGSIEAESGVIGGFKINPYSLTSTFLKDNGKPYIQLIGEDYILTKDSSPQTGKTYYYKNVSDKYIEFEGEDFEDDVDYFEQNGGKIVAENIELGSGAIINDYLKLGTAYIYNPKQHNNLLISAGSDTENEGYLKIYDTGNIDLGNIKLQGQNSIINLNSNDAKITAGNNVIITPGRSVFNNVDITGTLHTSVFEVGKVQTAGGAMVFKEGAEIDTIVSSGNNYNFTTKTLINLKQNSIVGFVKDNGVIYGVISSAVDHVYTTTTNITGCTNVIQLADSNGNNNYVNNLIIGINSGESEEKTGLYPQALTMRKITGYSNTTVDYDSKPVLVLGQLNNLGIDGVDGYGLYGQNVYLTGSLITEVSEDSYAGVNTLDGVSATKFGEGADDDTSRIVFWAGAKGKTVKEIQESDFQVTEQGSIYANKGIFEGAIISNSYVQAARLYVAHIYGGNEQNSAALNIHDTANGILFFNDRNNNSEELRINVNGLASNNGTYNFIKINNSSVDFLGNNFEGNYFKVLSEEGNFQGNLLTKPITNENNFLHIQDKQIASYKYQVNNGIKTEIAQDGKILLTNTVKIISQQNNIEVDASKINIFSPEIYILGENIKYKKKTVINNNIESIIGYDMYIS